MSGSSSEAEWRRLILSRLRKRDRQTNQFIGVVQAYGSVTESLNFLLTNKRSNVGSSNIESSELVEELKVELADLYKKKAINDQQLIDAKNKISELETRLGAVLEAKGEIEAAMREARDELKAKEKEIRELLEIKNQQGDEIIALHAVNNSLERKFVIAEQERVDILDRYKTLKEEHVKILNEFNEKEQLIRLQKMKLELEDAAKTPGDTPSRRGYFQAIQEKFSSSGRERTISESGSVGSVLSATAVFEDIPSRCSLKMECDNVGEVNDCVFDRTGRYFFTAGSDTIVRIFEIGNNGRASLKAKLPGSSSAIHRLDAHKDNALVLAASSDRSIRVYSIDDQRLRSALTGHTDKVTSAKFLSQTNRILSGSADRTVKLWDSSMSRCVKTFFPGSTVTDVATSDVNTLLISSHYDKVVRFWDSRADATASQIKLDGKITSMAVSSDGQKLLCCCRDETLSLVDLRCHAVEHLYSAESYRTSYDYCKCAISPGMTYVASGSSDGQIFIWNLHSTKLEKILTRGGHEGNPVFAVAYHPSGRSILSTDRRKQFCLWD